MAFGFYLEFRVPLKASLPKNGAHSIAFQINSVVGYPDWPAQVNAEVIFRTSFEDQQLTLDNGSITPIAQGC